ncbi:MAG: PspC domain-containing protein [Bacteroidales bacterium]
MDKTIKINLAGVLFIIDEKAYSVLRDYLQSVDMRLKNVPGGNEIIDDIEARIAEIFQSGKSESDIINTEDVNNVINIIGRPEEFEQEGGTERKSAYRIYRRRLYRDINNPVLGGVCSGIGAYLNIDPVWIRLIFIIFTFAYAAGILIYVILWIALPVAKTEIQKRELYGENYYSKQTGRDSPETAKLTGALNSFFLALGRIFRLVAWFFLAIAGAVMVVTGFAMLVAFSLVFYLRYPVSFFHEGAETGIFSISDFLELAASPAITPWIMVLISFVVILPLLALIYWGLKMIFRFKANELWLSISALVVWVISFTALLMILVSQGINFAEKGRISEQIYPQSKPDTLYIKTVSKISELGFYREFTIPGTNYSLFMVNDGNRLFSKPEIELHSPEGEKFFISVEKTMFGSTRREAVRKAEALIFNYSFSGDTLYVDQYYEIPPGFKWSGSFVEAGVYLPENTVIWIDKDAEILFGDEYCEVPDFGGKYWLWDGEKLVSLLKGETN